MYDVIIIGAGLAGIVAARELAERGNKKILILERRPFVSGNCYDFCNEDGIMVQSFGPHIFHTCNERVFKYISRFCDLINYQHKALAKIKDQLIPVPFNLNSLNILFDSKKASRIENKLINEYGKESKISIFELQKNDDDEIKELAKFIYENVFLKYSTKQWGQNPLDLDPSILSRIPIFVSRDDRYYQDPFQGIPKEGFHKMCEKILDHPNITYKLNCEAKDFIKIPNVYQGDTGKCEFEGKSFEGIIIFTGQVDEFFDTFYGLLPYRTINFVFETYDMNYFQPSAQVNYTIQEDFTRITEFKYMYNQHSIKKTTISKEYSSQFLGSKGETPYYAIVNPDSMELYKKYVNLAQKIHNFYLLGRLAEFQYYYMDQIILKALEFADQILKK